MCEIKVTTATSKTLDFRLREKLQQPDINHSKKAYALYISLQEYSREGNDKNYYLRTYSQKDLLNQFGEDYLLTSLKAVIKRFSPSLGKDSFLKNIAVVRKELDHGEFKIEIFRFKNGSDYRKLLSD
ncbi:MAG: hypothetical protein WC460_05105 [Patescibacteria group bacterium]